jgi:hypothetical protein
VPLNFTSSTITHLALPITGPLSLQHASATTHKLRTLSPSRALPDSCTVSTVGQALRLACGRSGALTLLSHAPHTHLQLTGEDGVYPSRSCGRSTYSRHALTWHSITQAKRTRRAHIYPSKGTAYHAESYTCASYLVFCLCAW